MKSILFITYLVSAMLLYSCSNNNKSTANTNSKDSPKSLKNKTFEETAVIMIYSFYHKYIILNSVEKVNGQEIIALKKRNCTPELLKKIAAEQADYDKFLNAQDCDFSWVKTLKVEVDSANKDIYNVSYSPDDQSRIKIRLTVREKNDSFRIDSILE